MFMWFVPIVVGSAAGFQCFNTALDMLPIPAPPGKYSGKDRFRWRNAATSLFNSIQAACIALYCLYSHPSVWTDPMTYYTLVADVGFAILTGYLVYDTYDILLYRKSKGTTMVMHHIIIGSTLFMLSYERMAMGIIYIGILTEVNAIFLHSRQLLLMYEVSKSSLTYRVHKTVNLVTFVTLRLIPLLFNCYCSFTMIDSSFTTLVYVLPCYTMAICTFNFILLWRLLCSDFLTRNVKETHILDG